MCKNVEVTANLTEKKYSESNDNVIFKELLNKQHNNNNNT